MKKKKKEVIVTKRGIVLFDGKLIELPITEEYVIKRSIELFDDDDPCIIHKSYIMKDFSDLILTLFSESNSNIITGDKYILQFNSIDFTEKDQLVIELKG